MRLLLDTHAFLWFVLGSSELSQKAQSLIVDPEFDKWVSPAVFWEIAIKVSIKKYQLNVPHEEFMEKALITNGFGVLDIKPKHTAIVASLPFHHKDPFDRLMVSQAMADDMPLVSADEVFDAYGVQRMW